MRVQTAQLPGGIALPYVESGGADGVPLVLLHGISDHWRSFEPVFAHLPAGIRAVATTLRGHGGASQPPAGYAVADLAGDVVALLDVLGVERAVLAGHSLGALTALRAAVDAPERVAGIVLAPGFASLRGTTSAADLTATFRGLRDPVDREFAEWLQEGALQPHMPPGMFAAMVEHTLMIPARVWHALVDGVLDHDLGDRLPKIAAPALLIWGDRDAFVGRRLQDRLLRGLPHAELRVYAGVGHTPHWEDPSRWARDVAGFTLGVRDRRAAA